MIELKTDRAQITNLVSWFAGIPDKAMKLITSEFSKTIIGNNAHGLRHYPAYKYVKPFRSYSLDPEKARRQRAWIFTHLNQIGHTNRTGLQALGWTYTPISGGGGKITNSAPGIQYTMGDTTRTRHQTAVGWKTTAQVIAEMLPDAIANARLALANWLRSHK